MWKVGKEMVKGVQQKVVEINNPESSYFNKAILFVNPKQVAAGEQELNEQAKRFVDQYLKHTALPVRPERRRRMPWKILAQVGFGAVGGLLAGAALFLR